MSDRKADLKKCDTINDIFDFLTTECASFLNYEILQDILEFYEIPEDQERLQYPKHLKAYIEKHKVSEFVKINPMLKKHVNGSKELMLKFDIDTTCKLAKVVELKKFVAKTLDLQPSTLHLIDIKEGCVVVTFTVPASVADAIFTSNKVLTMQQEDELRAASVLWLKCNDFFFNLEEKAFKQEVHTKKSLGMYTNSWLYTCNRDTP